MKVAVITRHAIANYGSLLQALATQKAIEALGFSCEIIDYTREDESYRNWEKTLLKQKAKWNDSRLKKMLYLAVRQPEGYFAGKRFEAERKKCLSLSAEYHNGEELKQHPPVADVFMTGSDQVWGPVANATYDSNYCLSFTDKRKVAYAASFGRTEMTAETFDYFCKYLSEYDYLAVRESSAVEMIARMGLSAQQVLDPTLLLSAHEWEQYMEPIKAKRYVLAYQLHNDKKLGQYAQKIAKERGVPLIRISSSFHQCMREGRFVFCPSVGQFLSYIKNAECLVTDSFHGTAFAINFNTPFVEVLPNNNTGTRNTSLLSMTGLSHRILGQCDDVNLAFGEIDFTHANSVIQEMREKSYRILREMIKPE